MSIFAQIWRIRSRWEQQRAPQTQTKMWVFYKGAQFTIGADYATPPMKIGDAAKVNDVTDQADSSVLSIGVRIEYGSNHRSLF